MKEEESGEEELIGMMQFHMTSAVYLMRMNLENNLVERGLLRRVITSMAEKSKCVREEALWETYKDFLDEEIDKILAPVIRFPEGDQA
jgi:hypothetical protein|tara:strand:+ start:4053 stop:4316 length:264 start_codon:yes stop_codon:yes gene_type:complete